MKNIFFVIIFGFSFESALAAVSADTCSENLNLTTIKNGVISQDSIRTLCKNNEPRIEDKDKKTGKISYCKLAYTELNAKKTAAEGFITQRCQTIVEKFTDQECSNAECIEKSISLNREAIDGYNSLAVDLKPLSDSLRSSAKDNNIRIMSYYHTEAKKALEDFNRYANATEPAEIAKYENAVQILDKHGISRSNGKKELKDLQDLITAIDKNTIFEKQSTFSDIESKLKGHILISEQFIAAYGLKALAIEIESAAASAKTEVQSIETRNQELSGKKNKQASLTEQEEERKRKISNDSKITEDRNSANALATYGVPLLTVATPFITSAMQNKQTAATTPDAQMFGNNPNAMAESHKTASPTVLASKDDDSKKDSSAASKQVDVEKNFTPQSTGAENQAAFANTGEQSLKAFSGDLDKGSLANGNRGITSFSGSAGGAALSSETSKDLFKGIKEELSSESAKAKEDNGINLAGGGAAASSSSSSSFDSMLKGLDTSFELPKIGDLLPGEPGSALDNTNLMLGKTSDEISDLIGNKQKSATEKQLSSTNKSLFTRVKESHVRCLMRGCVTSEKGGKI
ncbi:MAG: hypothetical protein M9962_03170 [Oligoflexia bacterium]|nr:hypothetical protein [Oligoflexia bacterium]